MSPNGGRSPHGYPPKPEIHRNLEATRDIPLGKPFNLPFLKRSKAVKEESLSSIRKHIPPKESK